MRASINAAMSDEPASVISLAPVKIDLGELKAPRATRIDLLRRGSILALCVGLHAALLLILEPKPQVTTFEEAIPVEVIVEQPPEEAAPTPEKAEEPPPEKQAQKLDEPPAKDFARATDQDREDGSASQLAPAEVKEPEAAPKQELAEIEPPPPAPDAALALPSAPPPKVKPAPRFAGLTPLPDFQFSEPPAKRSDMPRGSAQPGYLSTLYGMIMRKMPAVPAQTRPMRGSVTFGVMSNGRIFKEAIAVPSGAPLLDAAALGAVRRAAPFPAPPNGGTVYIVFNYGAN
jgi:protein TonB